ncbi:F-BAR domain only protein 1-like [Chiloscyllium plagiosum]|uniref:F-BAR domain only protein 1-like n=1 Tax=Chiloscyllium plagiosum TaxID=36176 RepID=UPI001CB7EF8D|nr:F-BAR domain only protein 1-like [Chiloscyllium plagiosum]
MRRNFFTQGTVNLWNSQLQRVDARLLSIFKTEGEKNNGFDILYHNMKHGQISVKELADFVRERALIEEMYSKSMSKLSKMVSNSSLGTFAPMWDVFRTSADKLALCHFELVRKLNDLIKEMNRFNEEQVKMHRKTKEEVSGTLEAVQNVQSSGQLLQKYKDNYQSKWLEWDRLKKDGASQKEIDKAEAKSKKAAESYKASIKKYRTARSDYQLKMADAAQKFQQVEEIHLRHMKGLIKSYSHSIEDTHVQVGQVHEEFKQNVENIRVQDLIQKYALTKGTGKEKPGPIEFEECNPEVLLEAPKKSKRKSFVIPGLGKREKDTDSTGSPDADSIIILLLPGLDLDTKLFFFHMTTLISVFAPNTEATMFQCSSPGSEASRTTASQNGDSFLDPLFGPPLDAMFEKQELGAQCHQVDGNPLPLSAPTSSSALETVEDSGLDSPSLPTTDTSSPSPESRPWTPQPVTPPASLPLNSCFSPTCNEASSRPVPVCNLLSNEGPSSMDLHCGADRELSPVDTCSNTEPSVQTPQGLATNTIASATAASSVQAEASVRETTLVAPPRRHSKKKLFAILLEGTDATRPVSPSVLSPAASQSPVDEAAMTHPSQNRTTTPASSVCISRGPSPVTVGSHDTLPIAAAFTECIDAYFRAGDFANVIVKLTGDLTMSFPAGIIRIFSGNPSPAVISFRILNANRISQFLSNSQLLYSDLSQSDSDVKDFWLNMSALTVQLQKQAKQNPGASYFNISLLKYQVSTLDCSAIPLKVAAHWKCELGYTEVTLDYEPDPGSTAKELRNLQTLLPLEGGVSNIQSQPTAVWNSKQKRLCWKLPDICTQSGPEGNSC